MSLEARISKLEAALAGGAVCVAVSVPYDSTDAECDRLADAEIKSRGLLPQQVGLLVFVNKFCTDAQPGHNP